MLARVLLVAVVGALLSAPAPAFAASDFWQSEARPDGATQYFCGDACAETQLICVHEVVPDQNPVLIKDIADETVVPWGQIDFSVMLRIAGDRDGAAGAGKNVDGRRLKGPVIVSFGDADWVSAQYGLRAKTGQLDGQLLLWPGPVGVVMLRCSYYGGVDDDGSTVAIRQLAESLRLTP